MLHQMLPHWVVHTMVATKKLTVGRSGVRSHDSSGAGPQDSQHMNELGHTMSLLHYDLLGPVH